MMKKRGWIIGLLVLSGLAGFWLSWWMHQQRETQVPQPSHVMQTYHFPISFVAQLKGDPRAGEKIFGEYCGSCHAKQPIIDVHAPRIGDKAAWTVRKQMGMDKLMQLTTHGVGAMPARGGCFECSDDQLRAAITYIFSQSS